MKDNACVCHGVEGKAPGTTLAVTEFGCREIPDYHMQATHFQSSSSHRDEPKLIHVYIPKVQDYIENLKKTITLTSPAMPASKNDHQMTLITLYIITITYPPSFKTSDGVETGIVGISERTNAVVRIENTTVELIHDECPMNKWIKNNDHTKQEVDQFIATSLSAGVYQTLCNGLWSYMLVIVIVKELEFNASKLELLDGDEVSIRCTGEVATGSDLNINQISIYRANQALKTYHPPRDPSSWRTTIDASVALTSYYNESGDYSCTWSIDLKDFNVFFLMNKTLYLETLLPMQDVSFQSFNTCVNDPLPCSYRSKPKAHKFHLNCSLGKDKKYSNMASVDSSGESGNSSSDNGDGGAGGSSSSGESSGSGINLEVKFDSNNITFGVPGFFQCQCVAYNYVFGVEMSGKSKAQIDVQDCSSLLLTYLGVAFVCILLLGGITVATYVLFEIKNAKKLEQQRAIMAGSAMPFGKRSIKLPSSDTEKRRSKDSDDTSSSKPGKFFGK
ncbi:hypothetical protein HELRODRAFT_161949 [Helobdella robusta]|uniref:Uncharacterized protein n=1 Tax=Helobdella robusta TaxID=6412 RepID=T1ES26_HELRO|nr:hypothetical protein HELRODRAFT_161949 [Helobdella robusta]ESO02659.1 hypothetical protein HELRODRAFT_161949 [Helobdella robusta]